MTKRATAEQSLLHYCAMLWDRWNGEEGAESIRQAATEYRNGNGVTAKETSMFCGFCVGVYCAVAEMEMEKGREEI